jgi:hypothetical protein
LDSIRGFLFTLFAWILFAICGFTFLQNESIGSIDMKKPASQQVAPAKYTGTADLSILKGEQVIGMVPFALAGNFNLRIDTMLIDINTDITTIDLRGVPGLNYTIAITRDVNGIENVIATHG